MMLYVIAIEELILWIKDKKSIQGYITNVAERYEIKISAYADDIVGYVTDETSIKEFFMEFDEWGEISGAKLNKDKTKIIRLRYVNEKKLTWKS